MAAKKKATTKKKAPSKKSSGAGEDAYQKRKKEYEAATGEKYKEGRDYNGYVEGILQKKNF